MRGESILQMALALGLWPTVLPYLGNRMNRGTLAERVGFEPTIGYSPIHAFQACAFNRSAISPMRLGPKFSRCGAPCAPGFNVRWFRWP